MEQPKGEAGDGYRYELDDRPEQRVDDAEHEAGEDQRNPLVEVTETVRNVAVRDCRRRQDAVNDIGSDKDGDCVDEGPPDDLHRRKTTSILSEHPAAEH